MIERLMGYSSPARIRRLSRDHNSPHIQAILMAIIMQQHHRIKGKGNYIAIIASVRTTQLILARNYMVNLEKKEKRNSQRLIKSLVILLIKLISQLLMIDISKL